MPSARGREPGARGRRGLAYVGYIANSALVTLELGLGRPEDALERSRGVRRDAGLDFWDALDRIESTVRAGEPTRSRARRSSRSRRGPSTAARRGPAPVALHCRALLARRSGDAEELFRAALDLHAQASRPFERARTELAFGEFLRRGRRRDEARRAPARRARRLRGTRRAAHGPSARASSCAPAARPRAGATPARSTSSRRRSCRSSSRVAEGHSNRDVAAQLFLSPRTIDFHLRNVFRKLGVSSRIELVHLAPDGSGCVRRALPVRSRWSVGAIQATTWSSVVHAAAAAGA